MTHDLSRRPPTPELSDLLRTLADEVEELKDVFVHDFVVARELGLDGYEFRGTLYLEFDDSEADDNR